MTSIVVETDIRFFTRTPSRKNDVEIPNENNKTKTKTQ